nr:RNA-directed DNA polymerase, eukaryota, reverse transcriptase zinc-binding domain protein [Tanacetum cinerariifolium]
MYDHCSMNLNIPKSMIARKKSFKFVNLVAEKEEFLEEVDKEWKHNVEDCQMFKVLKKMKDLKQAMKKLNWKNGNLFDNVAMLKEELQEIQRKFYIDPHDKKLRIKEAEN